MSKKNTDIRSSKLLGIVFAAGLVLACSAMASCASEETGNSNANAEVPTVPVNGDYAPSSGEYNLADDYAELSQDNIFKVANAQETFKFIEHGTGLLMFGYPDCPWCHKYLPMLEKLAKEQGIEKIVYYDVKKSRLDDPESYAKLLELLGGEDGYPQYNPDGELRIFVPFCACLDHGKIIFADDETSKLDAREITPEDYWDEEHVQAFAAKMDEPLGKVAEALEGCSACN